jgi:hypothetical protein
MGRMVLFALYESQGLEHEYPADIKGLSVTYFTQILTNNCVKIMGGRHHIS